MTWTEFHKNAERLANAARSAAQKGDREDAASLYRQAAAAEMQALNGLDPSKQRTFGITTVSATSLLYKARDFGQAELLAHEWLTKDVLPDFAAAQLRDILQTIWSEASLERAGVRFFGDEILVSVKGGKVVTGGAPLELVLLKVEQVSKFLLRTVEWLVHAPHRKREAADPNIESLCQPWVFQAAPGSYQFAIRMQEPPQQDMFRAASVEGRQVASAALEIMRASIEPEGNLTGVVSDPEYRSTFLRMTRNLAPSGPQASFDQVEFRQASDQETAPIILRSENQHGITRFLRKQAPRPHSEAGRINEIEIQGVLRNLSLDRDWIEVVTGDEQARKKYRISGAGDAVDDLIGPMVNKMVIVEAWDMGEDKYKFRDIRPLG